MLTEHLLRVLVIGIVACAFVGCATTGARHPPSPASGGYEYVEPGTDGNQIGYAVWTPPGVESTTGMPAILFLHGRGESGADVALPTKVGLGPALERDPGSWPFVVIMPQKPDHGSEWEDHEQAVLAVLDREVSRRGLDASRVYLTGLSQGGHGTMEYAARHPERFAAAAAVCGYVSRLRPPGDTTSSVTWSNVTPTSPSVTRLAAALEHVPFRLYHGGRDNVVPPVFSEALASALESLGADVALKIYPEANHNSWDQAYADETLPTWLLSHGADR